MNVDVDALAGRIYQVRIFDALVASAQSGRKLRNSNFVDLQGVKVFPKVGLLSGLLLQQGRQHAESGTVEWVFPMPVDIRYCGGVGYHCYALARDIGIVFNPTPGSTSKLIVLS